ncbi:type II secretion system F family protein [Sneathiella marina]|uniref:Type II secretion system F family protein n=1 Tax=Sneathiella marina TaxID=2950108 RepID=A0ABY4WB93_9PROT|nr:type II secretion system F family protein [Sneathiella marina]USG63040.1 type II secretion system F family protein [Sneathiella marina]
MSLPDYTDLSAFNLQLGICAGFLFSGCYIGFTLYRAWRKKLRQWSVRLSDIPEFDALDSDEKQMDLPELILSPEQSKRNIWRYIFESEWPKRLHLICACSVALVGFLFPEFLSFVFVLLVVLSMSWTLLWGVNKLSKRRTNLFLNQLPEAIDIIVRGAQLGKSISQNLSIVGEEMPAPAGPIFRQLSHQLSLGVDLETALLSMREISNIKEIQFLATTLALQREFGGEYAKILEDLSRLLRDRQAHILKSKALTSEARLSAKVISAMTIAVLGFLAITNETQFEFLLHDPSGRLLLLYCLISNVVGLFSVSFFIKGVK